MTDNELKTVKELIYIANEIAYAMAANPEKTAREIAGDVSDPQEELARLVRAIEAARKLVG